MSHQPSLRKFPYRDRIKEIEEIFEQNGKDGKAREPIIDPSVNDDLQKEVDKLDRMGDVLSPL